MFNYHIDKQGQTSWFYSDKDKAFLVVANTEIQKGEVIAVNYGYKESSRILHYYGFIPEDNPYECVIIPIIFNKEDPNLTIKQKLMKTTKMELRNVKFYNEGSNLSFKNYKVLCYLRFIEFTENPTYLQAVFLDNLF